MYTYRENGVFFCNIPNCYQEVKDFKTTIKQEGAISPERLKDALNLLKEIKEARRVIEKEIRLYSVELSFKIVKDLKEEFNILLNIQDNKGNTPLHNAVLLGQFEDVKTLIKYGADFLIQNKDEKTPLGLAQGGMKKLFIEDMKNQARLKKEEALSNSGLTLIPLTVMLPSLLVVPAGIMLMAVLSTSVGSTVMFVPPVIAVSIALATSATLYYTDLNYKEAKKIENTIDTVVNSKLSVNAIDGKDNEIVSRQF